MESFLNSVHQILSQENEIFVPMKKIWHSLSPHYSSFDWATFDRSVRDDDRFIVHDLPYDEDLLWDDEEMSKLGYFRGPRVGLVAKKPTDMQFALLMEKKLNELMDTLTAVYSKHGEKKEFLEDEYIELMQEAKRILEIVKVESGQYEDELSSK